MGKVLSKSHLFRLSFASQCGKISKCKTTKPGNKYGKVAEALCLCSERLLPMRTATTTAAEAHQPPRPPLPLRHPARHPAWARPPGRCLPSPARLPLSSPDNHHQNPGPWRNARPWEAPSSQLWSLSSGKSSRRRIYTAKLTSRLCPVAPLSPLQLP